jgi:hypothetical protein
MVSGQSYHVRRKVHAGYVGNFGGDVSQDHASAATYIQYVMRRNELELGYDVVKQALSHLLCPVGRWAAGFVTVDGEFICGGLKVFNPRVKEGT